MSNKNITKIPDAELDIMLLLWQKSPMRVIEIYDGLRETHPLTKAAIHTLLDRLSDRGFVEIEPACEAKPYKLITPLVGEDEYRASASHSFLHKLCRGKWQTLVATLIDSEDVTEEDLADIRRMLDERSVK